MRCWVRGVLARLPGSALSPCDRRCAEPLAWAISLHSPPSLCPALRCMGYCPHLAEVETEAPNSEITFSRFLWSIQKMSPGLSGSQVQVIAS